MKSMIRIITAALFLAVPFSAQSAFQDMSLGARPQGMGGAFTAIADDANAVFWNPAGLAQLRRQDATFMHGLLQDVQGLNIDYLAYGVPFERGAFGLGWLTLGATLEQGEFADSSRFSEDTFFITGAFKSSIFNDDDMALGVNLKRLGINSGLESGAGMAFDVGVLFKAHEHFQAAFVARNLAADLKDESYPAYYKLGFAAPLWDNKLKLAVDLDTKDNIAGKKGLNIRYHAGAELFLAEMISLRGGYDNGDLTAGGGFMYNGMKLDYAYRVSEVFGGYHRISLGLAFGPEVGTAPVKKKKPEPKPKAVKKKTAVNKELEDTGITVTDEDDGKTTITLSGDDKLKFQVGSAVLNEDAKTSLRQIAAVLSKYPSRKIRLMGYSDNTGSEQTNTEISGYRAEVVRKQLIEFGLDQDRFLSVKGMGPKNPIADNSTEEGRNKNRRVEIVLD